MIKTNQQTNSDFDSDADLLNVFCCHGDEAAFAELVRRHSSMVFGVCHQTLGHRQDAQDAFQATFLVLATRARSIKNESSLAGWLYKVAYRTSMRAAKRRQRTRFAAIPDDVVVTDDPLKTIHRQSLQLALHEELARIPPSYQGPVILCYLEGKSRHQAAKELECSDASVKARLARGKKLLRARLSRRGIALSAAITACSAGIAAMASSVTQQLVATTVTGCLTSLSSNAFVFPSSVTNLITQGNTMNPISTTAKYLAIACVTSVAFLGIAWATEIASAREASSKQFIQMQQADSPHNPFEADLIVDQIPEDAVRLVNDNQAFLFAMGMQSDDNKTKILKDRIKHAEKKSAAYLVLRDAELEIAKLADDSVSQLESEAKAKLHEAEAEKLAIEIAEWKSKLSARAIKLRSGNAREVVLGFGEAGEVSFHRPEPAPCCRENNLAYGRSVTASSQEEIINNFAQLAVDGDLSTRWCADDDSSGQWIQVDLGARKDVSKIRIHWEMMETKYQYQIETSADGKSWQLRTNTSDNPVENHMPEHVLDAKAIQFIRVTFLGGEGYWGSIREIEVTDGELSDPPTEAWEKVRDDATGASLDGILWFDA